MCLPGCEVDVDAELPHVVWDAHAPSVVGGAGQLVEEVAPDDRDRGGGVQVDLGPDALDEGCKILHAFSSDALVGQSIIVAVIIRALGTIHKGHPHRGGGRGVGPKADIVREVA